MNEMERRRDIKRYIVLCSSLLRNSKTLDEVTHQNILDDLNNSLIELESLSYDEHREENYKLILQRRKELNNNLPLHDIFQIIWSLVIEYIENNCLNKIGFIKLYRSFQYALHGPSPLTADFDMHLIEIDYISDIKCFGELNMISFFDSLYENIEMLTDLIDPFYYETFIWILLDSIADMRKFPPKLKPLFEIPCFLKNPNLTDLYCNNLYIFILKIIFK